MINVSFDIFVFGSSGVLLRFAGLMDAQKIVETCSFSVFAFLFCFFLRLNFPCFQKYVDFFMLTIFFGNFVFVSIGVLPYVFGLINARKIIKACLVVMFVFFVCFSAIEFFVFPKLC